MLQLKKGNCKAKNKRTDKNPPQATGQNHKPRQITASAQHTTATKQVKAHPPKAQTAQTGTTNKTPKRANAQQRANTISTHDSHKLKPILYGSGASTRHYTRQHRIKAHPPTR